MAHGLLLLRASQVRTAAPSASPVSQWPRLSSRSVITPPHQSWALPRPESASCSPPRGPRPQKFEDTDQPTYVIRPPPSQTRSRPGASPLNELRIRGHFNMTARDKGSGTGGEVKMGIEASPQLNSLDSPCPRVEKGDYPLPFLVPSRLSPFLSSSWKDQKKKDQNKKNKKVNHRQHRNLTIVVFQSPPIIHSLLTDPPTTEGEPSPARKPSKPTFPFP
ncbi:hypothetical protein F4802DRAFT_410827 [Xylaria palmicola]|nr:hypothetical protein F4802DRAFT_410827 [Xylaria palmicola]